ncbi:uncharacterized protein PHALS_05270 [Plasmopara halstedii]|uniref:Uncharacterized protein n=1 Tax=Plasmopara halstedii TaxID=4781 RepID=A0A0N7L7T2_PLAHL|nr:uncharacterized protein PHALS_05270 [Plasmopara halstedii]CEG47947.1 hypothetical protein PHALS_05270 [Plasmopara halstedii]|eukprot:XP_024584316.1 hypothetical protein PHALS_05270 [Plasmopara halstedii]
MGTFIMGMNAAEAEEIVSCMSDREEYQQHNDIIQSVESDEAENWTLQSVAKVLQQLQQAHGDEVNVAVLVRRLEQLPREAHAHDLVHLLLETREETIPKHAVLGLWGMLMMGNHRERVSVKSSTCIPILRSRLLESKRKQAECDLKMLQNRIALLQHEESKALKKIAQTKTRAQEILDLRVATLQRQEIKSMHQIEQERQSRFAQKKHYGLKKESVVKKKHAAIRIISQKNQDVEQIKAESKRLKAERERLQLLQVERARAKRLEIRRQEDALKKKKAFDRHQVDQEAALRLVKKAIAEERQIREHQMKVHEMEEAEQKLIQKLQDTQLIQREAYSVLEQALLRTDLKRAQSVAPLSTNKDSLKKS